MAQRIDVVIGMRVQLRKQHPCGSDEWTVTRSGADVGLACAGCGRRIMLEREEFERRVKRIVRAMPEVPAAQNLSAPSTLCNGSLPDAVPTPDKAGE